jgi:hypothetical protein
MLRLCAAIALALSPLAAAADEFTDTLESALAAYRDGDVTAARQDLEYASKLLAAMKAESLAKFLPPAQPGWTRAEGDAGGMAASMGMFGGGTTASATYRRDAQELTITLVADSPMVSGIAAMLGGVASMGGGKPIRVQRTEFGMNGEDLQGVVEDKVLVSVGGNASLEDKTAYLEAMDLRALADF